MKKMRKIIPAFAMLMVAAIMMSTASFAWFSMGTTAAANGMQIEAKATSSLIISNTRADSGAGEVSFEGRKTTVSFSGTAASLLPSTWRDAAGKLQYITNAGTSVDVNTGKTNGTETWGDATTEHYHDFIMYIASAGEETQTGTLSLTFTDLFGATKDIHKALSIQVLYKANKAATDYTTISDDIINVATISEDNVVEISGITIPAAFTQNSDGSYTETTNDYVTIALRVYFDGDLEVIGDATKNYVRNGSMDTTEIGFGVNYAFAVTTP